MFSLSHSSQPEPRSYSSIRWLCFKVSGWAGSSRILKHFFYSTFVNVLTTVLPTLDDVDGCHSVFSSRVVTCSKSTQSHRMNLNEINVQLHPQLEPAVDRECSLLCFRVKVRLSSKLETLLVFFLCLTTVVANRLEQSFGWYEWREELSSC